MAVFMGGASGARLAFDQADDNSADRLLALWAQEGFADTYVPDHGVILSRRIGHTTVDLDVGLNVHADGQSYGTNRLTSADAPFSKSMIGLPFTIYGHGQRIVETVTADRKSVV